MNVLGRTWEFFLKWWNIFLILAIFIIIWGIITVSNGGASSGTLGDVLNGIGRFFLVLINIAIVVGGWIIDAISKAPNPFG